MIKVESSSSRGRGVDVNRETRSRLDPGSPSSDPSRPPMSPRPPRLSSPGASSSGDRAVSPSSSSPSPRAESPADHHGTGSRIESDSFAIIPTTVLMVDLVRTALLRLGYSSTDAVGAKGKLIN